MPRSVALRLLGEVALKGGVEVNARLVGEAHHHPQHVGELIAKVFIIVAGFARLLSIATSYDARHLANFLAEYRHVGQLIEVAHTIGLNPLVNALLRLLYSHLVPNINVGFLTNKLTLALQNTTD